jgi:hypothetical protein
MRPGRHGQKAIRENLIQIDFRTEHSISTRVVGSKPHFNSMTHLVLYAGVFSAVINKNSIPIFS